MSEEQYSFSMSYSFGSVPPATSPAPRYISLPFDARVIGQDTALLLVNGGDRVQQLPLQLAQLLGQCGQFATLDEHVRQISQQSGMSPTQAGAVRQSLDELVRLGLLQTPDRVLERLKANDAGEAGIDKADITTLFIRTCDRPEALDRLLDSLAARPLPSGLKHCVVLDDSREAPWYRKTREVVDRHRSRFEGRLQLVDRVQRRRMLARLAHEVGVDEASLSWTITGSDTDTAPSYGANLNFALLLGAGTRMALMDDDATFQACTFKDCSQQPEIHASQSARLAFPEPGRALADAPYAALEGHPLAAHGEWLGCTMTGLSAKAVATADTLLGDLDPQSLADLATGSRVRLSSSGVLGDPGTRSIHWVFTEQAAHLQPLCESEQRYHQLLGQRRLARSALQPSASAVFGLMTTTLTGVDNRELLLPTQPRGNNEDLLFGALTGFLHPDSLHMNLPHMLHHERVETRQWDLTEMERPRPLGRGAFLTSRVNRLGAEITAADVDSRMGLLGEAFRNLAREKRDRLAWELRHVLLSRRSALAGKISTTRSELQAPAWLDQDFARILTHLGQFSDEDEAAIGALTDSLPGFLETYAAALPHWAGAWRHCQAVGTAGLLAQVVEEQPAAVSV